MLKTEIFPCGWHVSHFELPVLTKINMGDKMDNITFANYLMGLIAGLTLLLFGWTHTRASQAHTKIDTERKDNEARFRLCYEKIAEQGRLTEACRQQIGLRIDSHMTEVQVKDFVDRTTKPIEKTLAEMHSDIKTIMRDRANE